MMHFLSVKIVLPFLSKPQRNDTFCDDSSGSSLFAKVPVFQFRE